MNTAVYSGPVMEPDSLCHTKLQKSLMSGREGGCMYGKKGWAVYRGVKRRCERRLGCNNEQNRAWQSGNRDD